ncbi:hypothetical protein ADUPG1_006209 [Aduncisulcus paluster]|uniref:Uncharacterized protein n=1 Tax=Aduncisulcus paluster TaxID=2918883 RepID=A0ABQ5KKA6_9EUKA|nr:hypothetical protein ADUPG1_006209 [Aduncisulcus paluster]
MSLFIRKKTPEEIIACEAREKLWSEAPIVKAEFVKEGDEESFGRDSIPIPRDDPKLVDPSFSMVKCKDDSTSKESKEHDKSSQAQRMLKGENYVCLSHLSIPFPSLSPMKGAYICVNKNASSPSLLFTFTDCDGMKTCKKYEFTKPEHIFEWHFLPIDLDNVVLCEIEGKGQWCNKNSRWFGIYSLVFLRGDDIPTSPPLLTPVPVPSSSSKTPTSTLSLPSKHVKEEAVKEDVKEALPVKEEEEEKTESRGKKDIPSSSKQQTESLTQETKTSEPTKSNPNQPTSSTPSQHPIPVPLPQTLTSSCTITPLCIIGKGGFGVVILARVEYPASYCSPPVLCSEVYEEQRVM